ncbi:hypothetical protein ACWD25_40510, partial [Streptomyces sp. NPDC002920]
MAWRRWAARVSFSSSPWSVACCVSTEHPDKLVVYGGTGKAARDWRSFDAMVRTLRT